MDKPRANRKLDLFTVYIPKSDKTSVLHAFKTCPIYNTNGLYYTIEQVDNKTDIWTIYTKPQTEIIGHTIEVESIIKEHMSVILKAANYASMVPTYETTWYTHKSLFVQYTSVDELDDWVHYTETQLGIPLRYTLCEDLNRTIRLYLIFNNTKFNLSKAILMVKKIESNFKSIVKNKPPSPLRQSMSASDFTLK